MALDELPEALRPALREDVPRRALGVGRDPSLVLGVRLPHVFVIGESRPEVGDLVVLLRGHPVDAKKRPRDGPRPRPARRVFDEAARGIGREQEGCRQKKGEHRSRATGRATGRGATTSSRTGAAEGGGGTKPRSPFVSPAAGSKPPRRQ